MGHFLASSLDPKPCLATHRMPLGRLCDFPDLRVMMRMSVNEYKAFGP